MTVGALTFRVEPDFITGGGAGGFFSNFRRTTFGLPHVQSRRERQYVHLTTIFHMFHCLSVSRWHEG